MYKYRFYKILRMFHLISKRKYKKKTACYQFMKTEEYKAVAKSKLFDKQWYLSKNPDVKKSGIDPIEHYLKFGWKEARECTPYFDGNEYLRMYPDVAKANVNPLVHWELYGKKENRKFFQVDTKLNGLQQEEYKQNKNYFYSVIVASYNYQDFIQETLDSLVSQTYKNFEVIVVDDGSKDNSVNVIKKYVNKYPFIHLYQHKNGINRGLPETVALGVKKAKGEYIAFCESDDYWTTNHLEEINKKINIESNVQIIVNDVETFGDEKRCEEMTRVIEHRKRTIISQNGFISDDKFAVSNYILTFSSCCIRSDLLRTCNVVDVPKKTALDWWLWRQICYQNRIFYIDEKLTYWRMHLSYNIRDIVGEEQKHAEFVKKLNRIMDKRKYDSVYHNNVKLSEIDCLEILELKAKRRTIISDIKNENWKNIRICYISTTNQINRPIGDGSTRYRCYHPAETLSAKGAFVTVVSHDAFLKSLSYCYDIYVFHRPCKAELSIITTLKKLGKIVIADYDDLIFGNQCVAVQSSLYKNLKISLNQITANFQNNLDMLLLFDFVSVSTEGLKKEILRVYPDANVFVIHNFIPDSILTLSEKRQIRAMPKDKNLLMYCTGTLSHNQDFNQIESILLRCLEKDKYLKLCIFGVLSATDNLQKSGRVFFHDVVDYWHLFDVMAVAAFTIAPLETPSRFNECKSNVKFLESSVAGSTLLATPIGDMVRVQSAAIQFCNTPSDWEQIILNREQVNIERNIDKNFDYVLRNCSSNVFINEFKNIFYAME